MIAIIFLVELCYGWFRAKVEIERKKEGKREWEGEYLIYPHVRAGPDLIWIVEAVANSVDHFWYVCAGKLGSRWANSITSFFGPTCRKNRMARVNASQQLRICDRFGEFATKSLQGQEYAVGLIVQRR